MNKIVARFGIAAALVSLAVVATAGGPPKRRVTAGRAPKLAVIIMVDQMRGDYVDRFEGEWTSGLKRLVTSGAWFQQIAYPYLTTVTCAGHASVSTGAFPHTHGIMQNAWWDREERKQVACTDDEAVRPVSYGKDASAADAASGGRLEVPTFADEMRRQRGSHVVTLSLKARSAIMLAGHGGDSVTWLSETGDAWVTSTAFASSPIPAVKAYVDAHPVSADFGKTWDRLLSASHYHTPDAGVGEVPPKGWTSSFPHVMKGSTGKPDADFFAQWERSPYADAYLGRMAAALVEGFRLGKHNGTDVLGISFSTPDLVGHAFGPDSQEVEDIYANLDRTVGTLLARLDVIVGRGEYVVALTADHGVTPIPEQLMAAGKDGGRLKVPEIVSAIEKRIEPALGPGKHVNRLNGNDLYFEPGVYEKLKETPAVLDGIIAGLEAQPGIRKVFKSEDVRSAADAADPLLRAAALSYFPGRSGDLIVALKPGWMGGSVAATHGSASRDDQHVPVLLMGRGIRPGRYMTAATPADVTPTLAVICGIAMPSAEGHPLRDAIIARPLVHTTHTSGQ